MSKLEQLELAVRSLSAQEREAFSAWFAALEGEEWEVAPCRLTTGEPLTRAEFEQLIAEGLPDADAGRLVPFDFEDIRRRGREQLAARRTGSAP